MPNVHLKCLSYVLLVDYLKLKTHKNLKEKQKFDSGNKEKNLEEKVKKRVVWIVKGNINKV